MRDPDVTYRGFEEKLREFELANWGEEDNKSVNEASTDLANNESSVLSTPEEGPVRRVGDKTPWLRALLDEEPNLLEQWKTKRTRIADLKDELFNLRRELVELENQMNEVKESDDLDDYI